MRGSSFSRKALINVGATNELREAARALEWAIDFSLPRWAYNSEEWMELLIKKQVLRKKVAEAKKKLSKL